MLRKLHLKNFRQHENLVLHFEDGLVVLRGKNEAGKSSIILGALYALFGAKVLPLPLASTVTWGKPESSLAVELIIQVEGEQYLFKRSKSGAECHYTGGSVIGQTEVSKFAAEIIGEDYARVSKLMIANQNNLRGALEEGPAKVAEYIEDLSGMDLFDNLLTLAGEHLLSGNAGVFETAVVDAQQVLDSVQAAIVEPDWVSFAAQIEEAEKQRDEALAAVAEVKPKHVEANATLQDLRARAQAREQVVNQIGVLNKQLEDTHAELAKQETKAGETVNPDLIATIEKDIEKAQGVVKLATTYTLLTQLVYPKAAYWTGTRTTFDEYEKNAHAQKTKLLREDSTLEARQEVLEMDAAQPLEINTVCPTCGQEFADAAAKQAHLDEMTAEVNKAKASLVTLKQLRSDIKKKVAEYDSDIYDLQRIRETATPFLNFMLIHKDLIDVDENFFPPKITWRGEVPVLNPDALPALQNYLRATKALELEATLAKTRVEGLQQRSKELNQQISSLKENLVDVDEAKLSNLTAAVFQMEEAIHLANWKANDMGNRVVAINTARDVELAKYNTALQGLEVAKQQLETAEKQLATVRFNNNLIKKIRAARPLVADKLWSTVLLSVNSMFTQMRGTPSVVTKDKDGFAVNGEPIAGLSGSTLDILGLALRSSLVKSFLPHTSMMVLDEPAAAMDDDRAVNMLGFIAASGFKQTLLITHEDISEQFADQIISL